VFFLLLQHQAVDMGPAVLGRAVLAVPVVAGLLVAH
jgi:hypothetical protein